MDINNFYLITKQPRGTKNKVIMQFKKISSTNRTKRMDHIDDTGGVQ